MPTTDLEHSGIIDVIIPWLDAAPESHCKEKVEETMYMSPQVHVELIQTCPESLKAIVPQTTIGMRSIAHKQVALKGTAVPNPRASPEKKVESKESQFQPCAKDGIGNHEVLEESRSQRADERLDDVPAELCRLHDREQAARKMCQVLANLKDRRSKFHLECFEPHESVEAVLDKSEREAEDIHPASFDSGYASEVELSNKNLRQQ